MEANALSLYSELIRFCCTVVFLFTVFGLLVNLLRFVFRIRPGIKERFVEMLTYCFHNTITFLL